MPTNDDAFRSLVACDYDLIASQGVLLPTARYYDSHILGSLPKRCGLVVDAGCGTGELTRRLSLRAERVLGVDISPVMVEMAKRAVPLANVEFQEAALEALPRLLPPQSCSAIVASRVLHHCSDIPGVIPALMELLEPGGRLVILDLDHVGSACSVPRRAALWVLYIASVLLKGLISGKPLTALKDLGLERKAYASKGWQQHLSHEPAFDRRQIDSALACAGAECSSSRLNWKVYLYVAVKRSSGSGASHDTVDS